MIGSYTPTTPSVDVSQIHTTLAKLRAQVERGSLRASIPPVYKPFFRPMRYKGAYGGRGGAKSETFGRLVLYTILYRWEQYRKSTRVVCIREVQESLSQSVKLLIDDLIIKYSLSHLFQSTATHITTPGGGLILFKGMQSYTAANIKSLQGFDIAWVEEAQSLSERSLKLLRPTIRNEGSEIWFSWNPDRDDDPIDRFLRGPEPPSNAIVLKVNYYDNPYFPDTLRQEMETDQRRDVEYYQHVWLGEYETHSEARVFKNWTIEKFETPANSIFYYGADWGFSVDPSVLVRMYFDDDAKKLYIDREAYKVGVEIDDLPTFFDTLDSAAAREWIVTADSARPETISYMKRHGYPRMEAAIKGSNSVKEGVIFLQSYDIVIHESCTHTIEEFSSYSFVKDKKSETITPILEDKKNHVIDAVRYATERVRAPQQFVSW